MIVLLIQKLYCQIVKLLNSFSVVLKADVDVSFNDVVDVVVFVEVVDVVDVVVVVVFHLSFPHQHMFACFLQHCCMFCFSLWFDFDSFYDITRS